MTQTALRPPPASQAQPTYAPPVYEITPEDRKRQQRIERAWSAYNGELPAPLTPMEGEPDDNVLSNHMQPVVDRGVDFLFGMELEISVEEGAPKEAQALLDATWGRKEARIPLLQKLAMNGAMAGTAFLRIRPSTSAITRATTYRLVAVDPSTVFVQTAPQDCDTVLLYCIEFSAQGIRDGKPVTLTYREEISRVDPDGNASLGLPDSDDTWQIQHWSRVQAQGVGKSQAAADWQAAGPPIEWHYPFPPMFACQNLPKPNDFWGTPDITPDLIGVNSALNLVQSNISRVLKLYAGPILYAPGTGSGKIDVAPGKIIQLALPDQKIEAVAIHSDIANALAFAGNLRSDIDEQSGVPGVATGRIEIMPRGALSGIAIELLFMPTLKKTDKKRCSYGELLIDVSQALFVLAGMSGDIDVTLHWQNPIPKDDLQSTQAAIAKKELGMTNTSLLLSIGEDPEEEAKRSESEIEGKLVKQLQSSMPPAIPGTPALPGQVFPKPAPASPGHAHATPDTLALESHPV